MKTIGRDKIRKEPLDHDCYSAKTTRNEFGMDDNRVFCLGLLNECDDIQIKCIRCRAFVDNAEPLKVGDVNDSD
jgi:hypothetical protein